MLDVAATADTATTVAAIIGAAGAVIAASIAAYAIIRAQSYKQLLRDIAECVRDALHEELDANDRGPVIATHVVRAIREALGADSPHRRRWYDR